MNEPASVNVLQPIFQYGFAGFSGVLLAIIVWLTKRLLGLLADNNRIITEHTAITRESLKILRDLKSKIITRPCIAKHEQ